MHYATANKKTVVLAVRSEHGFLEYRIKAVTQTFLTGTGIAAMLENRGTKKLEGKERARELKEVKEGIQHSYLRCKRAMVGKEPPESKIRPLSAFDRATSSAGSPLDVTAVEESLPSKKMSFVSTLDSTLNEIEANPVEYFKAIAAKEEANAVTVINAGGTTQRAGATTSRMTARSSGSTTGRSKYSKFSARSFSTLSMASSRRSSTAGGARSSKGAPMEIDEDLIALDKGQWARVVLKARVPAAMRLEWALQELEVQKGKRTGETATRRYIKTMPRDIRRRDQELNMADVMVRTTTG